ncbi:MAG: flagellar protein [Defluviitaleaceae bacterium]|nr:flagellar protein [Defluviitaleaceae bacterium]MCL2263471.1 flagellar protein [Defluviitaleaceae bacterium]
MQAMNCPRCGKVFVRIRDPICEACVKEEEQIFENVREFIKENPNLSLNEVAEACEVTVKRIMTYIRDGRIDASQGMRADVTCSKCGKPIPGGRMCEKCVLETNFQLNDMKNTKKGAGMFTNRR